MKPGGSAAGEVLYARIYDCRVEMPGDWASHVDATLTIEDVTVTIERGLWQTTAIGDASTTYNIASTLAPLASSASSSVSVGGDTDALYWLQLFQDTDVGASINRAIIGYRSASLGGSNYASLGKKEAESQTNGTDTSDAADATASGGNKVTCTFGTATIATRLSGSGIPYGVHRVFARMKITSTAVATVNVKYQDNNPAGVVYSANNSVSVSSTSWLIYDMGVVRYYEDGIGSLVSGTATGVWALDALRASGSGNLDIDYLFFMPTEGYLTASGIALQYDAANPDILMFDKVRAAFMIAQVYRSTAYARTSSLSYTASFSPVPGAFALYWIAGVDSGSVFDSPLTGSISVYIAATPRYLMPSVV